MAYKPEIQYIGQFYVHGSEARELAAKPAPRKAKTRLPAAKPQQVRKVHVDPVAICALAVAAVMLVVMVMGAVQLQNTWNQFQAVSGYVTSLKQTHIQLQNTYHSGYNLAEIEEAALALGMIPVSEAQTLQIQVTVPEPEPEPTYWENLTWFLKGLFA